MNPRLSMRFFRHPRMLAVGVSLFAHAAVAAAGYVYVGWPRDMAVTVIPVEIVTASAVRGGDAPPENAKQSADASAKPRHAPPTPTSESTIEHAALDAKEAEPARPQPAEAPIARPLESPMEEPSAEPAPAQPVDELQEAAVPAKTTEISTVLRFPDTPAANIQSPLDREALELEVTRSKRPETFAEPKLDVEMPVVASVPLPTWNIPAPSELKSATPSWSLPVSAPAKKPRSKSAPRRSDMQTAALPVRPTVAPQSAGAKAIPPLPLSRPPRPVSQERAAVPVPPAPVREDNRDNTSKPLPRSAGTPAKPPATQANENRTQSARLGAPGTEPAPPRTGNSNLGNDLRPMPGNPAPRYPRLARERGWQGRVVVEVAVNGQGSVDRAEVDQSSGHRALDMAALQAVKRWRFAFTAQKSARATMVRVPIIFKLSDE